MKAHTKARNAEDKAERRADLLKAAAAVFDTVPYAKITMAEVAQRAGLSKGTVYLYFETKEELFLALLEDLLFAWYDTLDRRLDAARRWRRLWGVARGLRGSSSTSSSGTSRACGSAASAARPRGLDPRRRSSMGAS